MAGFGLWFGDSDVDCGKVWGKVGKEWGFAVGLGCGKVKDGVW